jgi:hypothetical protein
VAKIIGKNQSQMAEMLGVSCETVKSACLGRADVSPELSHKIMITTGAAIAAGRITVTTEPKDVWGRAYTSKSFERAEREIMGAKWQGYAREIAASGMLLMEAAGNSDKAKVVAQDVARALRDVAKKHRLGAELGRMLGAIPRPSWVLSGRSCELRAVFKLEAVPRSDLNSKPVLKMQRLIVALAARYGGQPDPDWEHPLTVDLRNSGGDPDDVVTIYGKSNQSAEWPKLLEELPTLSGIASYCVNVRSALRLKRSPV